MENNPLEQNSQEYQVLDNKNTIYWKSVFFLIFIVIVGFFLIPRINFNQLKPVPKVTKPVLPSTEITKTPKAKQVSKKIIIREKKTRKNLISLSDPSLTQIASWKNYLLYADNISNPTNHIIYAYDFTTNTKSIIFEAPNTDTNVIAYLDSFAVIDDTFYFTLGQYANTSPFYYMTLPPKQPPSILLEGSNTSIKKLRNSYFLVSGMGDGCGGYRTFQSYDPKTRAIGPSIRSNEGCAYGISIIGIDTNGKFYASKHEEIKDPRPQELEFSNGFYKNLLRINPSDPSKIETLISEEDMPSFITKIHYFEKSDKLGFIMNGNLFLLYDPNMKKLSDQLSSPVSNDNFSLVQEVAHNSICLIQGNVYGKYDLSLYEDSLIFGGAFMDNNSAKVKCDKIAEDARNFSKKELDDFVDNLKIPEGFEIVVE